MNRGNRTKYRKQLLVWVLMIAFAVTGFAGCKRNQSSDRETMYATGENQTYGSNGGLISGDETKEALQGETEETAEDVGNSAVEENGDTNELGTMGDIGGNAAYAGTSINQEMLVYRSNVKLESQKFEEAYEKLRAVVQGKDAFLESERLSAFDQGSRLYTANIRVASKSYSEMLQEIGKTAKVVSRTSSTENVSKEYSDTEKALEIYEAKEARYIKRIKDIKDDSVLIQVEKELTELQVKIAQLKGRRDQIETDVAYSYIQVELQEVTKPAEVKKSTFFSRLKDEFSDAGKSFLEFLEGLISLVIHVVPALVVLILIGFGIVKLFRFLFGRKGRKNKKEKADHADNSQENEEKQ